MTIKIPKIHMGAQNTIKMQTSPKNKEQCQRHHCILF